MLSRAATPTAAPAGAFSGTSTPVVGSATGMTLNVAEPWFTTRRTSTGSGSGALVSAQAASATVRSAAARPICGAFRDSDMIQHPEFDHGEISTAPASAQGPDAH